MKRKEKAHQGCEEEVEVVEGAGAEECTMGVWNMVMVGMVGEDMVAEGVAVEGVVVSGDEDVGMVPSQLGTTTMVNMMHHHLLHVAVDVEGEEAVDVVVILEMEQAGEQLLDQVVVGYSVYVSVRRWLPVLGSLWDML